jgi:hypothetical protein
MGGIAAGGRDWPDRLLEQAGLLRLITTGWARLDDLPEPVRADLRAQVGWSFPSDEVRRGPVTADAWHVVSQRITEEDRLRARRTWLWGQATNRPALVLDFVPSGGSFEPDWIIGSVAEAELAFYPGAAPLRALPLTRSGPPVAPSARPGWATIDEALAAHAAAVAACPWTERFPLSLLGVVPVQRDGGWALRDDQAALLPFEDRDGLGWRLTALSGGHPLAVFGEWDRDRLHPLSAFGGGRTVTL